MGKTKLPEGQTQRGRNSFYHFGAFGLRQEYAGERTAQAAQRCGFRCLLDHAGSAWLSVKWTRVHFTTREEFERMVEAGMFLEHAEVFGNLYGTARQSLDEARAQGHDLLLDIDVQGAAQVRSTLPEAVSIFVLPPNPKVLRTRLRNRSRAEGVVHEAELYRRLSEASKEIENFRQYGYILVNDILDRAVAQLEAIVLAERFYRNGEAIAYRSRRVLEVAAACLQANTQERLKPVLEAFGILGDSRQQELNFEEDSDDD